MTITEIKKALYKEKPEATLLHIRKANSKVVLVYGCEFGTQQGYPNLFFEVPIEEIADGLMSVTYPAKLLIRYIVQPETT